MSLLRGHGKGVQGFPLDLALAFTLCFLSSQAKMPLVISHWRLAQDGSHWRKESTQEKGLLLPYVSLGCKGDTKVRST